MEKLSGIQENREFVEARETSRNWGTMLVWALVLGLLDILGLGLARAQEGPIGIGRNFPEFTLTTFYGAKRHINKHRRKVCL